ncbi:MAG TPA: VTT domain-containing protein [Candidatus Eisenbacteria bacterium]
MIAHSLWVLCLLLFLDGATFSFATTPLLLHYGRYHEPALIALFGGAASAAGSALQLVLLRRILSSSHPYMRRFAPSRDKLEAALRSYPSAVFVALLVARATPLPDAPLKLAAAAAGYPAARYALAVFLGALPYYFALAIAGRKFHIPPWVLIAATIALALGVVVDRLRRRGKDAAGAGGSESEPGR